MWKAILAALLILLATKAARGQTAPTTRHFQSRICSEKCRKPLPAGTRNQRFKPGPHQHGSVPDAG